MTILAEAAYLYKKFNTEEATTVFLASTDKCMSPNLDGNGNIVSNDLTEEIGQKLSVCCDWPERITDVLKTCYN